MIDKGLESLPEAITTLINQAMVLERQRHIQANPYERTSEREELCGFEITSTEVSQAAKLLDKELSQWRKRPLKSYHHLYLDAQYQKVRYAGSISDCAILIGAGVDDDGKPDILVISVSLSEHEVHWREFFCQLQERGMHGVLLIISDAHAGLKAARITVFTGIPWQRCQFHLQQNAQSYVTKTSKTRGCQCAKVYLNSTTSVSGQVI